MPKFSVIVPVYNTEKYLRKCLNSILNQSYKDFEVIIINDGSTDDSEKIIKEYINKYEGIIKYFKIDNSGLSNARNYGVSKAKGEYLIFVDSDDYLDINLFSNLQFHILQNIDLIKFKMIKVDDKYEEITRIDGPVFEGLRGEDAFNLLLKNDKFLEISWLYVYNRKFWQMNNFHFNENLYHEDYGLTPLIIVKAKSVVSTNIYGYYYVQAPNSITRNMNYIKTIKKAYDLFTHYDNMIETIKGFDICKDTKDNMKIFYTNSILLKTKSLKKQEKKDYIHEIKKRKLIKNIKVKNFRQFIKKILLNININWYLKFKSI